MKYKSTLTLTLGLSLLMAVEAPAASIYAGGVIDAVGDSTGVSDIIYAQIRVDEVAIHFRMDFAPGTLNPAITRSGFSLDTDQNPSTGGNWNGIGVDFVATQGYLGDSAAAHLWKDGVGFIATSPVLFSTNSVMYSFALGLFGSEDGLLDFITHVQTSLSAGSATTIYDFAPDPISLSSPASTEPVPEPSTYAMFSLGALALGVFARRGDSNRN